MALGNLVFLIIHTYNEPNWSEQLSDQSKLCHNMKKFGGYHSMQLNLNFSDLTLFSLTRSNLMAVLFKCVCLNEAIFCHNSPTMFVFCSELYFECSSYPSWWRSTRSASRWGWRSTTWSTRRRLSSCRRIWKQLCREESRGGIFAAWNEIVS